MKVSSFSRFVPLFDRCQLMVVNMEEEGSEETKETKIYHVPLYLHFFISSLPSTTVHAGHQYGKGRLGSERNNRKESRSRRIQKRKRTVKKKRLGTERRLGSCDSDCQSV